MNKVAILGGCRTAFCKAGTKLARHDALSLGKHVVEKSISTLELKESEIDELVFSSVLLNPRTPNLAREIILRSELSNRISAHFISNNCISGLVAINAISEGIQSGRIQCGLAGGAESMSQPTFTFSKSAESFFMKMNGSRSTGQMLSNLASFRPKFLAPVPPSPKEPSTGLTMGQHCELTAKEFSVTRDEQDAWAYKSHAAAALAEKEGYLSDEIVSLGEAERDNFVRADTSVEKLAKLRTVFDTSDAGTLTAGNSSGLTDGASIVCLMDEAKAKSESREILGYIEGVQYSSINPDDGLLMAPALALPKLLESLSLGTKDVDFFEIHEAFSAQVISNRIAWGDGWKKYPELNKIGEIPDEKINPNGGSIAIGHPFAATGGRLILSAVNHLKRAGKKRAVISVCAAGAMAAAVSIIRP